MALICKQCGKEFIRGNNHRKTQSFCSRTCAVDAMRTSVVRTCQWCGNEFGVQPNQMKVGRGKFCSRACHYASRMKSVTLICPVCGDSFEVIPSRTNSEYGVHCSKECGNIGQGLAKQDRVSVTCKHCGKAFDTVLNRLENGRGIYCSKECYYLSDSFKTHGHARSGKRADLDNTYFRSSWEANYARLLNRLQDRYLIRGWAFEPELFRLDDGTRYLPDFRVIAMGGDVAYHEVKGYMRKKAQAKLNKMGKCHPDVRVVLIDAGKYKALEDVYASAVPNWEYT